MARHAPPPAQWRRWVTPRTVAAAVAVLIVVVAIAWWIAPDVAPAAQGPVTVAPTGTSRAEGVRGPRQPIPPTPAVVPSDFTTADAAESRACRCAPRSPISTTSSPPPAPSTSSSPADPPPIETTTTTSTSTLTSTSCIDLLAEPLDCLPATRTDPTTSRSSNEGEPS